MRIPGKKRIWGTLGALASAAALAVTTIPAQAATAPSWHQVFDRHYGPAGGFSGFDGVAAFGENNVWAFGGSDFNMSGVPVAARWNGTTWVGSRLPAGVTSHIIAVSAPAANDIWAVTFYGGYVLHYNGSTWSVAKKLSANGLLDGVVALAANNVWVFGTSGFGPGDGTWHYNGSRWTQWTGKYDAIVGASAVNARDIWGLASVSAPGDTLVRFNGTAWEPASTTGIPAGMSLGSLHPISDTNIWATGSLYKNNSNIPYLLHFNGTRWTAGTLPWAVATGDVSLLSSPTSDGAGGLWFTGTVIHNGPGNAFTRRYYVVHRSATGLWTRVQTGSDIVAPSGSGTTLTDTVSGASLGALALIPGTRYLAGAGVAAARADTSSSAVVWAYGSI